jgi:isocitrate dehydrogenase kinase/phosphatase
MSDTPWYSVEEHDVFPETFGPFFFADAQDMKIFKKNHADLMDPAWWKQVKENILTGQQADIFPYSHKKRFGNRDCRA